MGVLALSIIPLGLLVWLANIIKDIINDLRWMLRELNKYYENKKNKTH